MYLVYSIETTGLPKKLSASIKDVENWPRLIKLSYIVLDFSYNTLKERDFLIYPDGFEIQDETFKWNGVNNEVAIRNGIDLKEVLHEFNQEIKYVDIVVSHNLDFNEKIILSECYRLSLQSHLPSKKKICTMLSSTDLCKIEGNNSNYKWPKLHELYHFLFNKSSEYKFNTLEKTFITAKCFAKLKSLDILNLDNNDYKLLINEDLINKCNIRKTDNNIVNDELFLSFFLRVIDEENEEIVLDFFFKFFPFDFVMIKSNEKILDFKKLSKNQNIIWTQELIEYYRDRWDWALLSVTIPLNYDLISKFESELEIESEITYYNFSSQDIFISHGISNNPKVKWDTLILDTYKDNLCWRDICKNKYIIWDEYVIDRYLEYIDWRELCQNEFIIWDEIYIDKYFNYIDWNSLSKNKCIQNIDILEKYKNKFNWGNISANNHIEWNLFLILKYKEKIDWEIFAMHNKYCHVVYNSDYKELVIDQNKNWDRIFINKYFEWNTILLKGVKHLIDEKRKKYISANTKIDWTVEFINENFNLIDWHELSKNKSLSWNPELIEKYKFYWDYESLANNESLDWYNWEFELNTIFIAHSNFKNIEWNIELFEKFYYYAKLEKNYKLNVFLKNNLSKKLLEETLSLIKKNQKIDTVNIGISKKNRLYKFDNIFDFNLFNYSIFRNNNDRIVNNIKVKNSGVLLVFTRNGIYYKLNVDEIHLNLKNYDNLISLSSLLNLEEGDEIVNIINVNDFQDDESILLLTENQKIYSLPIKRFLNNKCFIKILKGDFLYSAIKTKNRSHILISSNSGFIYRIIQSKFESISIGNNQNIIFNKIYSINSYLKELILIDANNVFCLSKIQDIPIFDIYTMKISDKIIYENFQLIEILPFKNNFNFEIYLENISLPIIIDLKTDLKKLYFNRIHTLENSSKIVKIKN